MIFVTVVLTMPTVLLIAINSNSVQNRVVQRVTVMLSDMLGSHISTGAVSMSWFNRVTVNDLLVTCLHGDTVLLTAELTARLNLFAFSSRRIELRKVVLNRADIRLANEGETDDINVKFIIDRFKSDDAPKSSKWAFGIRAIELNDSRFSFKKPYKEFDRPFGMDYGDINVSDLNIVISKFTTVSDSAGGVKFRIRRLTGVEQCGLTLENITADFFINNNNLSFKNIEINTSNSHIKGREVSFEFETFQNFSDGFFSSKVHKNVDVRSSEVAFEDLAYFVPYFAKYSGGVTITGRVTGTVENMKGEGMNVHFGAHTHISGNFDLNGLPNLRSTLIYADIDEMVTCPKDIELIQVERLPGGHVTIPENMHAFDKISFRGNFTGFFDDFVTFGTFNSNLGSLSTDLSIRPVKGADGIDTTFTFRGALRTENFYLGKLLRQPSIGNMTMSGAVEGSASVHGRIEANIEGNIQSVDLKGYEYRNIIANGAINNRMYDGHLSIDEPNIKVDFSGKVDMTEKIPEYDFLANVERANLYKLNIVEKDTTSFTAFKIKAEFSGTNIDNLSGELVLENTLFRRNNREIEVNDVLLFTKAIRDTNRFILRSDIFDAEVWGQYEFLKLPASFFSMVKNFAPAWVPASVNPDSLSHNSFRFDANFKDTQKLADFFVNQFSVARGTHIEGVYNPANRDVSFLLSVPYMQLGNMRWDGFFMNAGVEDSSFVVEAGCIKFKPNKNMSFDNPTVIARARSDSMNLDVRWNNWDTILHRGAVYSKLFFERRSNPKANQHIPLINIQSTPGLIVVANDIWRLTHSGITIDTTSIKIDNLRANMDNQEIFASGVISRSEQDRLQINVKDFDLSGLNKTMQFDQLLFGGIATGTASLSNLFEVPVFISDIAVNDFSLNENNFGDTYLSALWDSYNRSVHIEVESHLDGLQTLQIEGNYFITDQALDFDVHLDDVPVAIIQPYLEDIFTGLEGTVSGKIKVLGAIYSPVFNGDIEMNRVAMTLAYTKVRYSFSGGALVENNSLSLMGIEFFDRNRNSCRILDGFIQFDSFREISFDLQLQANNLEVLNTAENDNNMFYGRAFATGSIRIRGSPDDFSLDITGRTERNTRLNIPLASSDEMSRNSFITFVDRSRQAPRRPGLSSRTLAAVDTPDEPEREARYSVNLNVNVTPEAEVRIIFDSRIGDIIRARGAGNLNLSITNTRFDMRGTYTIEEGDYLFTLQNMFNKFFVIERGGIITWSGDPLGALLNIRAIYMARPSLFHLMNDENFRRSVPVECILNISNILTNPNIRFELDIPSSGQEVRSFLSAATSSEEEMTRQFLSLLLFNSFYPDFNNNSNTAPGTGLEMGLSTASEFLTNQLSYMLSQMTNIDISVGVRPGALDTGGQNWDLDIGNNWWKIHANYEVTAENAENVGEFSFEVRLPNRNKLRLKAFNRANAAYLSQNPYTQGVGVLFREDFNRISDLFRRKNATPARREDEVVEEPANEHISDSSKDKIKNDTLADEQIY